MLSSDYPIRPFAPDDYANVRRVWEDTAGIGLNESDTREAILMFIDRNPGLSLVATSKSKEIVGAVLCGHDGRRGYLHHLVVVEHARGKGLGATMVNQCLTNLKAAGILKTNIYLFSDNASGESFWNHQGWTKREDLVVMQRGLSGC